MAMGDNQCGERGLQENGGDGVYGVLQPGTSGGGQAYDNQHIQKNTEKKGIKEKNERQKIVFTKANQPA